MTMSVEQARQYYEHAHRLAHDRTVDRKVRTQARAAARFWWRILQRKVSPQRRDTA